MQNDIVRRPVVRPQSPQPQQVEQQTVSQSQTNEVADNPAESVSQEQLSQEEVKDEPQKEAVSENVPEQTVEHAHESNGPAIAISIAVITFITLAGAAVYAEVKSGDKKEPTNTQPAVLQPAESLPSTEEVNTGLGIQP